MLRLFTPVFFIASTYAGAVYGTTFSDTEFNDSEWTTYIARDTATGGASSSSSLQVSTGGNPDAFQESMISFPFGGGQEGVFMAQIYNSSSYTPSVDGPIENLSVDIGYNFISQFGGDFEISLRFAAVQAGDTFEASGIRVIDSAGRWQRWVRVDFDDSHFDNLTGTSPIDFSAGGSELLFGYVLVVGSEARRARTVDSVIGIDNWSVEITPVPEPCTLMISALAFYGLGSNRRR